MTDVFSKKKRSLIMSNIPSKNSRIEVAVFKYLRGQKIYFQKHYDKAPGKPDIALPSKKIAVFIDGDFWHGFSFDTWKSRIPRKYWRNKITENIARDKRNFRLLKRGGWRVLRIWGHEINGSPIETFSKIRKFILD